MQSHATLSAPVPARPALWVWGDWNGFFGYGANLLVNVLTLTGLLRYVLGMPEAFIYQRILPGLGVMLFLSALYYSWLAYRLARTTGRADVCALPSGPGVGHIFIVVLAVMMPIKLMTGDVTKAWEAGMAWVVLQSFVVIAGGFAGRWIRKVTPRAALLAALVGIALTYIAIQPMSQMFLTPVIGMVSFGIILLDWLGGAPILKRVPAGLIILGVGAAIGWGSNQFGLHFGGLSAVGVKASLSEFGFRIPMPAFGHVFSGFQYLPLLLATAVPFGIYDVVEAIDNVESAAGAGDDYPTSRVLVADGLISMIGALFGNPFMLVVYVGHPGWKAMGGRLGYAAASGAFILALCLFGALPVILAAVPAAAFAPILLFIGMIIGSQAFRETPKDHAPAIILGILPALAHWGAELIRDTLKATGAGAITPQVMDRLQDQGVLLHALDVLGGGAALTGIVLAAIAVLVIERRLVAAAGFCVAGAAFTYVGLMHSLSVGVGQSPLIAVGYLLLGVVILLGQLTVRFSRAAR
jgi:adenine/guanine/hypoxanthine permease